MGKTVSVPKKKANTSGFLEVFLPLNIKMNQIIAGTAAKTTATSSCHHSPESSSFTMRGYKSVYYSKNYCIFLGMICPKCQSESTRVVDSRDANGGRSIRRRRQCDKCDHRFTTFERIENGNFVVVKRDGARESYDRQKVVRGVWRACEKRPVTEEQIRKMIDQLEEVWSTNKEVRGEIIGRDVMYALRPIDEVAYIRFASVYRQFKDVESFIEEVKQLLGK